MIVRKDNCRQLAEAKNTVAKQFTSAIGGPKAAAVLCMVLLLAISLSCLPAAETSAEPFSLRTVTYTEGNQSVTVRADAEYIDMGDVVIKDYARFEQFVKGFSNLKKLDMFSTRIKKAQIEHLAATFPDIEFGWTIVIPCTNKLHPERTPHVIRTDATAFSTLHNNTCTSHSNEDLAVLRFCKNLQALDVGHNSLTDLSFLYSLPHLKVLIVACNINLRDITPIGSLKELQYLEIFKNDIHDISCLVNCPDLVDLNICFNRISDLTPIYQLKKLRRLWIYNSNNWSKEQPVPKAAVTALREALPDCYIDSVNWSTDGGWRVHPRYDTIYEMFWGTEYIPFTTLD